MTPSPISSRPASPSRITDDAPTTTPAAPAQPPERPSALKPRASAPGGAAPPAPRSSASAVRAERLDDTLHALSLAGVAARAPSGTQRKAARALSNMIASGRMPATGGLLDAFADGDIDAPRLREALLVHARHAGQAIDASASTEQVLRAVHPSADDARHRAIDRLRGAPGPLPTAVLIDIIDRVVDSAEAPSSLQRHLKAELLATFEGAALADPRGEIREARIGNDVQQAALLRPHTEAGLADIASRLEPLRGKPALAYALEAILRDALPHAFADVSDWVAAGWPRPGLAALPLQAELAVAGVLSAAGVLTAASASDADTAQRVRSAATAVVPVFMAFSALNAQRRDAAPVNARALHAFGPRDNRLPTVTVAQRDEAAHVARQVERERGGMLAILARFLPDVPADHLAAPLAALCDLPPGPDRDVLLRAVVPHLHRLDAARRPEVLTAALRNPALAPDDAVAAIEWIASAPPGSATAAAMAAATPHLGRMDPAEALQRVRDWSGEDGLLRRLAPRDIETAVVPLARLLHDLDAGEDDKVLLATVAQALPSLALTHAAMHSAPDTLAQRLRRQVEEAATPHELRSLLTIAEALNHDLPDAPRKQAMHPVLLSAAEFVADKPLDAASRLDAARLVLRTAARVGSGLRERPFEDSVLSDLTLPRVGAHFSERQFRSFVDPLLNAAASFQVDRPGHWVQRIANGVAERYAKPAGTDVLRDMNILHLDRVLRTAAARFPLVDPVTGRTLATTPRAFDADWTRRVEAARQRQAASARA